MTERTPRFRRRNEELATVADRAMLGIDASEIVFTRGPASDAVELAIEALRDGQLLAAETADSTAFYAAANTLYYAHAFELSLSMFSSASDEARPWFRSLCRDGIGLATTHRYAARALSDAVADADQLLTSWEQLGRSDCSSAPSPCWRHGSSAATWTPRRSSSTNRDWAARCPTHS